MTINQPNITVGMDNESQRTFEYNTQSCCWGWRACGALFGLLGGIVTVIIGSVLTAGTWITGVGGSGAYLHTLGSDFLFMTIPLLVFGGYCMDLEEKRERKQQ